MRAFSGVKTTKRPGPQFALNRSRARLSALTPLPGFDTLALTARSAGVAWAAMWAAATPYQQHPHWQAGVAAPVTWRPVTGAGCQARRRAPADCGQGHHRHAPGALGCAVVGMAGELATPKLGLALRHPDGRLHHL